MPKKLGLNWNEGEEWLVIFNKTEIVASFRLAIAAHQFASAHKKDYFYDLEVLTKDVYEWRLEELEEQSTQKPKKTIPEGLE
ncbi:unnamed protein product [marine sediment metagenome]|uniref:Uncharacterized protein n=1 Tax=marine sediment metagenome TaxID=412755 RepID=X1C2P1_9ZZZZ